jgi:hypothetical protein
MVNWFSAGVTSSQQISWPVGGGLASVQIFRQARLKVHSALILRSGAFAASRRMGRGIGASWFETREGALLTMRL